MTTVLLILSGIGFCSALVTLWFLCICIASGRSDKRGPR